MELFAAFLLFLFLYQKISRLEDVISEMRGKAKPQKDTAIIPTQLPSPPDEQAINSSSRKPESDLYTLLSKDWPLKAGALLILLGFVWLVTYAFLNNWIGPFGRITFGLLSGSLILFAGEKRITKVYNQGLVLVLLGASVMLVSVYAAQSLYQMFPSYIALFLVVLTMALTAIISIRHNDKALIVCALIIGGFAPVLTGESGATIGGLYGFLLALCIGSIWVVFKTGWRFLIPLSILIISPYSSTYFFSRQLLSNLRPSELLELRFFAVTFVSLFYFASTGILLIQKKAKNADLIAALLIGMFAIGWINGLSPVYLKSTLTLCVSILFIFVSFILSKQSSLPGIIFAYTGTSSVLLAIASGYAFDGPVLTLALATESALLPLIASRLLGETIGINLLAYFILPFLFSFPSFFSSAWLKGIWQNDFYALFAVTLSFFFTGWYFLSHKNVNSLKIASTPLSDAATALVVTGGVYALVLLWLVFHAGIDLPQIARTLTLFIYTIVGLYLYTTGKWHDRKVARNFGLIVLMFVIGRLLLFEVWSMQLAWRIVTFFVIGALLIGSVFLRKPKSI